MLELASRLVFESLFEILGILCILEINDDFIAEFKIEGDLETFCDVILLKDIVVPNMLPIAPLLALAALIAVEPADSLHSSLYFPTSKVDV